MDSKGEAGGENNRHSLNFLQKNSKRIYGWIALESFQDSGDDEKNRRHYTVYPCNPIIVWITRIFVKRVMTGVFVILSKAKNL